MQTWEDTETGTQVLLREIGQLSEEIENLRVYYRASRYRQRSYPISDIRLR
jgi:hypothetical protein